MLILGRSFHRASSLANQGGLVEAEVWGRPRGGSNREP